MALFLQENSQEEKIEISIEEAYEGLIEASLDMQDLTESLLQADFIIHEECKVLTEGEGEDKKESFLVKAAKVIREFVLKVRDTVVAFLTKISSVFDNLWKRYQAGKAYLSMDIKETEKFHKLINITQALQSKLFGFNAKDADNSEKSSMLDLIKDGSQYIKELSVVKTKPVTNFIKANPGKSATIFGFGTGLTATAISIKSIMTKHSTIIENIEKELADHRVNKINAKNIGLNPVSSGRVAKSSAKAYSESKKWVKEWEKELANYKFSTTSFLSLTRLVSGITNIIKTNVTVFDTKVSTSKAVASQVNNTLALNGLFQNIN